MNYIYTWKQLIKKNLQYSGERRVWKKEREGENVIFKLKSQKLKLRMNIIRFMKDDAVFLSHLEGRRAQQFILKFIAMTYF